jgi:plasmid maintenance system antidote protein VapI
MAKDPRYSSVNKLITNSSLESFSDVLAFVPKTVLARDLGIHHITFNKLIKSPERFTLKNIYHIASLFGVDKKAMLELFYNQTSGDKKSKRKK